MEQKSNINKSLAKADIFLLSFLNEYMIHVSSFIPTDINKGGCGVFAYELSTVLNSMNIEHEIVGIIPREEMVKNYHVQGMPKHLLETSKNFSDYCKGKNVDITEAIPIHMGIKLDKNILIDADGIIPGSSCPPNAIDCVPISKERLLPLINEPKAWNKGFDRDCIPAIRERLSEMPFDYGLFLGGASFPISETPLKVTEKTAKAREQEFINKQMERLMGGFLGRQSYGTE